jgi:hypothetical protein
LVFAASVTDWFKWQRLNPKECRNALFVRKAVQLEMVESVRDVIVLPGARNSPLLREPRLLKLLKDSKK